MSYGTSTNEVVRFQNNIQSLFNRVRLLYGATPLEDIINYNVVVRALTEWTSTNQNNTMDQTTIAEGIGGVTYGYSNNDNNSVPGWVNVRQNYIQGYSNAIGDLAATYGPKGTGPGAVPNTYLPSGVVPTSTIYTTRRYQINFALGLFTQDKLIPVKFMASQLAIEITLENANACIFSIPGTASGAAPSYAISNMNLIPEILEFDAKYDEMFLTGLREGGVPIKFSSWHTFIFNTGGASNLNLLVAERSRSVKALFAVQRRSTPLITTDSGALLFTTHDPGDATTPTTLQSYQYRIGGR